MWEIIVWLLDGIRNKLGERRNTNEARESYLNYILHESEMLGNDWLGGEERLHLETERAFIPVRLAGSDGHPVSLNTVLATKDRVVIKGQAGAGKTSLARFITRIMAMDMLKPKRHQRLSRERLGIEPLFPILVTLRECGDNKSVQEVMFSDTGLPREYVEEKLKEGKALILFDGLDEISDPQRRTGILKEIRKLTNRYRSDSDSHTNHFLVTTRPVGYDHRILAGGGYSLYTLMELSPDQQREMIHRYYELWAERLHNDNWDVMAEELVQQLDDVPGLSPLRGTPLLLAQIARLHFEGKSLPNRRHKLYEQCIRNLIERRVDYVDSAEVDKWLSVLGELAFAMHESESNEFPYARTHQVVSKALRRYHGENLVASETDYVIGRMESEWGLLVNTSAGSRSQARYSFINSVFREYLAAYAASRYPDTYWETLRAHLHDDWWKEVVFLYTAMPLPEQRTTVTPLDMVIDELINSQAPVPDKWITIGRLLSNEPQDRPHKHHDNIVNNLQRLSYGTDDIQIEALEALCQIKPDGSNFVLDRILGRSGPLDQEQIMSTIRRMTDPGARHHLREALLSALNERPKIRERVILATALGQVDDPRPGRLADVTHLLKRKGTTRTMIGKYPVTNAEYAAFVTEKGWTTPPHWRGEGYDPTIANHPVVNVSYEDALAYCEWMSKRTGYRYRLPTREEWELVATGGENILFPWGNRCDQYYCNWRNNEKGTTPVGIYFEGKTDCDVFDMLGNVWEWTQSQTGGSQVLKGGAWDTMDLDQHGIRIERQEPAPTRNANIGFRVLVEKSKS